MKTKKMLSFILSLGIMTSSFAGVGAVKAADVTDLGLTNVAVNGSFNEELGETWKLSTSAEGSIAIVDDTKDPSNKVLRYDGTANSKSISYINYTGAEADKTYYMTMKVRMADVESNTEDMYFFANSLSGIGKSYYSSTRPKLSKEDWVVCSGIVTTSANSKNTGFKAITVQSDSTKNYPTAVYEIDDFALYDMAGYYNLTLPTGVTVTSGVFSSNGVNYAKTGDTVVLNYENTTKVLASETAEIEKNGSEYTFTMPGKAVTVDLADPAAFTNLVANGDMEDTVNAPKWNKGGNATGAVITIETDTKDSANKVLRFNGTGIPDGGNSNPMSYVSYADKFAAGRYYYSYKIRQADSDTNTETMYVYNSQHSGKNDMDSPAIGKEQWVTRSGVFKTTAETSVNFKIVNNRTSPTTSSSNVPDVVYELDDVVMYNFANIYELVLPENVELVEGGRALDVTDSNLETVTKYYAEAGEAIKIEYKGEKRLSIVGTEITKTGDNYTFTMPGADATVTLVEPPFVNLVANGDMEGDVNNWKASSSVTGAVVSLVEDSADPTNHVLRYDGTKITSGTTSYMGYSNLLTEGKQYYYSYKIRQAQDDTNTGDMYAYNQNHTEKTEFDRPMVTKEWVNRSGYFKAQKTSYNFKITSDVTDSNKNVAKMIYELDDVVIYEVGYMKEITLPENTELVSGGKALTFTQKDLSTVTKYYAEPEKEVKLEQTNGKKLNIADVNMIKDGNTYTFVMPHSDVTVYLVDAAFTNLIENGDMEGELNNWKAAGSVKDADISLVEDTADTTNHVLRYDGTNISEGKISYVAYNGLLTVGKQYYYSYKIRQAESDTNTGDMYAYNKNHIATTELARPKVTKEWVSRSGVFTAKDTSYNFKITSTTEDSNANIANVIFELDDVVIYDLSYIYEIFMPSAITVTETDTVKELPVSISSSETVTKYYAEEETEVKFNYSGDKGLKADTEMSADGDNYTFIMPEYAVTISEVSSISFEIVNAVPNITVAKPQSFVVIAAKYNAANELEDVSFADIETTTENQTVSLSEMIEFSGIGDWNGRRVFVWDNFTNMNPLSSAFTCEIK